MKTKILIAILTVGVFSISTMKAQEKPMNMEQDTMQMDHSKMEMKHDSTEMKMDHSEIEMKQDATEMEMDDSKMTKAFVCPMHPEVNSDKPGECPKCGMDMGEKKMDVKKTDTPKKHKH
jgi:hypothetical protein